ILVKGRLLEVTTAKQRLLLLSIGFHATPQMVINSPCLTHIKNWLVQEQTALGKDFSNPFMANNLPKIVCNEALAILEQTAAGKETSNLLMAGSLPITILLTMLAVKLLLFMGLVKNIEAGVPFYMFPRFVQLIVEHQLGDMSHHQDIYDNPSLSKKVFSNMKRVGTGFSKVITPLFGNMLVPAAEEVGQVLDDVSIPTEPSTSKPHKKHKSKKQQPKAPKVPSPKPSPEHTIPLPSNDPIPDADKANKIEKLDVRVHKLEEENRILKEKSFKSAKIDTDAPDIDKEESAKVEEVLEVVTAAKLITEVVTIAEPTTTAAQVPKVGAPRRRRSVVIQDLEETAASIIVHTEQMLDNVRLEVKEESKMSLELLRLVRRQLNEGYVPE
nr:hypothetical protein [Tanacetum cinerariifolium]